MSGPLDKVCPVRRFCERSSRPQILTLPPTLTLTLTRCAGKRRLESVLYSLTAVSRELLALRQPALAQLQAAATWASTACTRVGLQSRVSRSQSQ